jgi:carbon-monoxide dehydrogenase small subunit
VSRERRTISLTVNGVQRSASVEPRWTLADFVREELRLTGTHLGCEHGVCGACTVMLDGSSVRSCLVLAVQADGASLLTVEGLAAADQLHPVQQAFWDAHALQCGFCTPGLLITAVEFLRENPDPSEEEIRVAISGNLCRCTGYVNVVRAISAAAEAIAAKPLRAQSAP